MAKEHEMATSVVDQTNWFTSVRVRKRRKVTTPQKTRLSAISVTMWAPAGHLNFRSMPVQ